MIIYLSGSNGFLGYSLSEYLQSKGLVQIVPISRRQLFGESPLHMELGSVVIHLAGLVHRRDKGSKTAWNDYFKVNVDATERLAEKAIAEQASRFIFVSSFAVYQYGRTATNDNYARSKWEAEERLRKLYWNGTQAVVLRLPMVYGPHAKGNPELLMKLALNRIPLPLGSLHEKRSYLFVGNFCNAVHQLLGTKKHVGLATFALVDSSPLSPADLYSAYFHSLWGSSGIFRFPVCWFRIARWLLAILEKTPLRGLLPMSSQTLGALVDPLVQSPQLFSEAFSWSPPHLAPQALAMTALWYKQNRGFTQVKRLASMT